MNSDRAQLFSDPSLADSYFADPDTTSKKAHYVNQYGLYLLESLQLKNRSVDEVKTNISQALKYLRNSAIMYGKFDKDKENEINLMVIKITEDIGSKIHEHALTLLKDNEAAIKFLNLAEKYYRDANIHKVNLNITPSFEFHLNRFVIHESLAEIDTKKQDKHLSFIEKQIKPKLNPDDYDQETLKKYRNDIYTRFLKKYYPDYKLDLVSDTKKRRVTIGGEIGPTKKNPDKSLAPALKHQFISNNNLSVNTKLKPHDAVKISYDAIDEFYLTTKPYINQQNAGQIILELARIYKSDLNIRNIMLYGTTEQERNDGQQFRATLILSLYESAVTLGNADATKELNDHIAQQACLLKTTLSERPPHDKNNISEINNVANFLKKTLEDHIVEIEVLYPKKTDKILTELLYKIGMLFDRNIIPLPEVPAKDLAQLFYTKAALLNNPDAISKSAKSGESPKDDGKHLSRSAPR